MIFGLLCQVSFSAMMAIILLLSHPCANVLDSFTNIFCIKCFARNIKAHTTYIFYLKKVDHFSEGLKATLTFGMKYLNCMSCMSWMHILCFFTYTVIKLCFSNKMSSLLQLHRRKFIAKSFSNKFVSMSKLSYLLT